MKFYTDVRQRGANILECGYEDGKRFKHEIPYAPSLYVPNTKEDTQHTIHGKPLAKIDFLNVYEAKQYIKDYSNVANFEIYGNDKYDTAYISSTYTDDKVDYDIDNIDYCIIDIETTTDYGNIDIFNTPEEIILITLISKKHGQITFGSRPYAGKYKSTYVYCTKESDLLKRFLEYWSSHMPDIITGWNSDYFDMVYIVGRIEKMLDTEYLKLLSPWKIVYTRDVKHNNKDAKLVEIYGVQQLDYLALYRKFRLIPRENYTLDTIAECEIKANKLKNPFNTFREFYENDFELFTDYNIRDVELVAGLEDKLRLIEIAISVAYSAHVNYSDVFSPVRVWESVISHYLMTRNIIPPYENSGNSSASYAGAYVKEPVLGLMGWNCSFDAKALYPSIIIGWNISPETLQEDRLNLSPETLFDNRYTFDKDNCICANGTQYSKEFRGFLPALMKDFLADRDIFKGRMIQAKKDLELAKTDEEKLILDKLIAKNRNMEQGIKILLNAAYGALANKFFKYYDIRLAEAITLMGQSILKCADKAFNDYLPKLGLESQDFVLYEDTDSCYVNIDPVVQRYFPNLPDSDKVDKIDLICKEKFAPMLAKAFDKFAEHTHAAEQTIFFKRENIASSGFWKAKKKYVLNVHDSEGVRYATPSLKVMGLEIVRSSTPAIVRKALEECVNIILDKDITELRTYVNDLKTKFYASTPEAIAFPKGVSDVDKYLCNSTLYTSGCTFGARAAILHNHYIKEKKLEQKYTKIVSGDKIKIVYLKKQNPIKENVIGFLGDYPVEIVGKHYVDYAVQWDKAFLKPLKTMLVTLNWELEETFTLDSFM